MKRVDIFSPLYALTLYFCVSCNNGYTMPVEKVPPTISPPTQSVPEKQPDQEKGSVSIIVIGGSYAHVKGSPASTS